MIATGSPWFSIAFRSPPNGFSAAPGSSWSFVPGVNPAVVRLGKKCVSLIRLADKSRTDTSKVQQRIPMDAEGKEIDDFTALGRGSRLWLQSGRCAVPDGLVQKQLTQDREGGERMKKPPGSLPGVTWGFGRLISPKIAPRRS